MSIYEAEISQFSKAEFMSSDWKDWPKEYIEVANKMLERFMSRYSKPEIVSDDWHVVQRFDLDDYPWELYRKVKIAA